MTVADVVIVGAIVLVGFAFWRSRGELAGAKAKVASRLILTGLAMVALFHLADLATMHLLPSIAGRAVAEELMMQLHLEASWPVTLAVVATIGLGFLQFKRDVSENVSLLAASEARYRSIVSEQRDFIVRWRPDGIRTWANEPYCRAFGLTLDSAIGTSFMGLIDAEDRVRVEREIRALTPRNSARTGIHKVRLAGGESGWQEWTDQALFDRDGKLIELQSVGRDVTHRLVAERALATSEARFRGLVESTTDWVWEIDATGCHTYSNARVANLLGYHPFELDGVHWHSMAHPDDLDDLDTRFKAHLEHKTGWERWLVRMRHKDGGYRFFDSSATPILDAAGRLTGFRGIDRDSTLFILMHRVSSHLVGCPTAEVDIRIRDSLDEIGTAYGLDRISLWWLEGKFAVRSHEWARPGMQGPKQSMSFAQAVPWMSSLLQAQQIVKLHSLDDVPPGVADRSFLESQGIRSSLVLPLVNEGRMIGVAVMSTVTEPRIWTDVVESESVQLIEKIVAAYAQAEATRRLARSEHDLEQSEALAHVGSFSYYPLTENAEFPHEWHGKFSEEQRALLEIDSTDDSFDTFMSRVHAEDRKRVLDAAQSLLSGRENEFELHYRAITPSGRTVHFANRTRIDRDAHGRNLRIIGANRDITEQVERETSLKQALTEIAELRDALELENLRLRDEVRSIKGFEEIVGDSAPLRQALDMVARAAPTDATILLLGETGTGKELVAKAIHRLSARSDKRLVSLNCTALPAELVESELFGHERGAFTGAHQQREGRFERANRGTLFLDEIGDLPLPLQSKLLRVIQEGAFERIGGSETIQVDVRIIAATNRDLKEAVAQGRFRADLYYRINTVTIYLPSLRERKEDIPTLAQHLLEKHGPKLNPAVDAISTGLLRYLQEQDWPGNVRELENRIEQSLIAARGNVLTLGEVEGLPNGAFAMQGMNGAPTAADLASVEREHIRRVLADAGWIIGGDHGAASRLGLPPSTLRSRMKKLGIARAD
jgi:formate hydrogenlyase transcriptional activator